MSLRLGGDGAITGCSSLSEPALTLSGLTVNNDSGTTGATVTAAGNAFLALDSSVGGTAGNQISFIDFKNNGTVTANISVNEGVTGQPLELNSATSSNVVLAVGGGNVGIGTSNPTEILEAVATGPRVCIRDSRTSITTATAALRLAESGAGGSVDNYWDLIADNTAGNFGFSIKEGTDARLAIKAGSGNVGIGTSSPNMLLAVEGASNPQIKVSATNTGSNSAGLYIENQGQRNWQIWADRSSDQLRIGHNSRASTVLTITDSRVGIGETNPGNKLVVRGNVVFGPENTTDQYQGLSFQHGKDSSAATATGFIDFRNDLNVADTHIFADHNTDGSSTIILGTTPAGARNSDRRSEKMRITGNGDVGIGTSSPIQKLSVLGTSNDTIDETTGTLRLQGSGGNGMLFGTQASSPFCSYIQSAFVADTSIARYALSLNPIGGNVGIGTSNPAQKLDVNSQYMRVGNTSTTGIIQYGANSTCS